jgi:hypothetical protein
MLMLKIILKKLKNILFNKKQFKSSYAWKQAETANKLLTTTQFSNLTCKQPYNAINAVAFYPYTV